ncbi:hypothetical protein PR003_g15039 [Phytophthora rubi]|uniref:Uncharacterized protein n=2 Tax=Phytophthora TaxID=4783 RepID=A0A6A4D3W9_9STRA|nr:hypothetical protein PF009_g16546 [Phytophthora fragariae]KAE9299772.1 hypothetical protein PF001_g15282 [Phytophthora fragariae]KAE9331366.1 hypothetical protein PR003_g15039 [Phytophthora rubi]
MTCGLYYRAGLEARQCHSESPERCKRLGDMTPSAPTCACPGDVGEDDWNTLRILPFVAWTLALPTPQRGDVQGIPVMLHPSMYLDTDITFAVSSVSPSISSVAQKRKRMNGYGVNDYVESSILLTINLCCAQVTCMYREAVT